MADNQPISDGLGATIIPATDDDGTALHQYVKLEYGGDGVFTKVSTGGNALPIQDGGNTITVDGTVTVSDGGSSISVDDNNGSLTVDNAALSVVGGGTEATALRVTLASDSTGVLSVDDNGSSLTVDGTFQSADGTAFDNDTTVGIPALGVYQATPDALADGDLGVPLLDENRKIQVVEENSTSIQSDISTIATAYGGGDLDINIVSSDIALPVSDNASSLSVDVSIPGGSPASQVWKSYNTTTGGTGATVWDPTASTKIAITYLALSVYGTTAGRVIIWFGDNGDTTYTAGTDQLVWAGSFTPSSTQKAGVVLQPTVPIFCNTANRELHITFDASMSADLVVYGYEF